jgi:hypothetical protein
MTLVPNLDENHTVGLPMTGCTVYFGDIRLAREVQAHLLRLALTADCGIYSNESHGSPSSIASNKLIITRNTARTSD